MRMTFRNLWRSLFPGLLAVVLGITSGSASPSRSASTGSGGTRHFARLAPAGQGQGQRGQGGGTPGQYPGTAVPANLGPNEYYQGQLWYGQSGITESVADLLAREAAQPAEPRVLRVAGNDADGDDDALPDLLRTNPDAPQTSQWPLPWQTPAPEIDLGPHSPQTVSTAFTGTHASFTSTVPPDSVGAVGPTQVLVPSNGIIQVFSKTGTIGTLNLTDKLFFASVLPAGTAPCDPRVTYDRSSARWFITEITCSGVTAANNILIAVSSGSTITNTSSFTFFGFKQDTVGTTPNADANNFADYDTLGVDANALYIGTNMFVGGGGTSTARRRSWSTRRTCSPAR